LKKRSRGYPTKLTERSWADNVVFHLGRFALLKPSTFFKTSKVRSRCMLDRSPAILPAKSPETLHSVEFDSQTLGLSNRFPPDIIEVHTFKDAWRELLKPDVTGVILRRDPEPFAGIAEDLGKCNLREWGRYQAKRFTGSKEEELSAHITQELKRVGVDPAFTDTLRLVTADMIRINHFIRAMTMEDDLRSHVGSMWRDDRGYHIDSGDNIAAFVTYIGPGCLVVGKDQVEYDSMNPAQRKNPVRLALKPGVTPYLAETFDITFIKGRSDLTNPSLENNVGLPHSSPNPSDPEKGFTRRLSYIAYGTAVGDRFKEAPDYSRMPASIPELDR
jgi:hypothetical protein